MHKSEYVCLITFLWCLSVFFFLSLVLFLILNYFENGHGQCWINITVCISVNGEMVHWWLLIVSRKNHLCQQLNEMFVFVCGRFHIMCEWSNRVVHFFYYNLVWVLFIWLDFSHIVHKMKVHIIECWTSVNFAEFFNYNLFFLSLCSLSTVDFISFNGFIHFNCGMSLMSCYNWPIRKINRPLFVLLFL